MLSRTYRWYILSIADPLPAGIADGVDSEKVDNIGYNAKVGFGYEVYDNAKVYVNAGYYSRQPYHDNIYTIIKSSQ